MLRAKSGLCLLMLLASVASGSHPGIGNSWSAAKSRVCLITDTESMNEFRSAVDKLERQFGFQAVFAFPPYAVIGYVPDAVRTVMHRDEAICVIEDLHGFENLPPSRLSPGAVGKIGPAWHAFLDPESVRESGADRTAIGKTPHPLINDIVVDDSGDRTDTWNKLTSEYLIGKIALGIFLMESNGHQEDWSNGPPNRPQSVFQKIIIGLNWMFERAQEGASSRYCHGLFA